MKKFIDEAYKKATVILTEHRDLLERIALTLLDRETIDREDLEHLVRGDALPPRPTSLPPAAPVATMPSGKPAPAPRPQGMLGAPGAEPAGA